MQPSNGLVKPILRFSDVQSFFGKLGDDFRIQCPAHDGEDENLSIKRAEDGGVLAKCRSRGCPFKDILAGLCARMGVKMRPAKLSPASELSWNYPAPSWLWLPYLPIGGVSLLVGDQSTGKTAFAAWVAARVTKGEAFPNMARFPVPDEVPPAAFVGWFDSGENGGANKRPAFRCGGCRR